MQISFNLPHVFYPGSSPRDNALVLRALLEFLIDVNTSYLRFHRVLPLYQSGVYYKRTQTWDCIPSLYALGYGDCKSLTAALVSEYRSKGIAADPVFRFNPNDRGGNDFHILVETVKGFEDPSRRLGMGANENAYFKQG